MGGVIGGGAYHTQGKIADRLGRRSRNAQDR
jgi:hypothetical protein